MGDPDVNHVQEGIGTAVHGHLAAGLAERFRVVEEETWRRKDDNEQGMACEPQQHYHTKPDHDGAQM
jgi:hypothetical protein